MTPVRPLSHPQLLKMSQHIQNTSAYCTEEGIRLVFTPLKLHECICNSGEFHRLKNSRRNALEDATVSRLSQTQEDKSQPLLLLSMGSGGLMSDFITIEKLILAGFEDILIDCVDPLEIDPTSIERIRKFFSTYPHAKVQIQAYKNVEELPQRAYSAVLAIDYDILTSFSLEHSFRGTADLIKARRLLNDKGFIALGFSNEDTLSGPKVNTAVLTPRPSFYLNLAADLAQQLKKQDEFFLAISSIGFESAHLFPYALAIAMEQIALTPSKISVSLIRNTYGNAANSHYMAMLQVLFPKSSIELGGHRESQKFDLIYTGSQEDEFMSKKYLGMINPESRTYILFRGGILFRQNGAQEDIRYQVR